MEKNPTVRTAEFKASVNICNSMPEASRNEIPYQLGKELLFILLELINYFFHWISGASPQPIFLSHDN